MTASDFLRVDLAEQCRDFTGEVNKVYQHLPWASKNEAVARLKRQVDRLSREVREAQDSRNRAQTRKRLEEALGLVHECVPLMSLCLRKVLLSPELHDRWVARLDLLEGQLNEWLRAC